MNASPRHRLNAASRSHLAFHLVWAVKYLRPVLDAPVAKRLREIVAEVATEHRFDVISLDIAPDHVRMTVEAPPALSAAEIVTRIKRASSPVLRSEFQALRSRLPTLWTLAFFASTVGPRVSDAAVRRFLDAQRHV